MKDFSVREEVRVIVEQNGLEKSIIDEVMDDVENDSVMLNAITTSIYRSILFVLNEKDIPSENIEEEYQRQLRYFFESINTI